jgi:hypothetical protein
MLREVKSDTLVWRECGKLWLTRVGNLFVYSHNKELPTTGYATDFGSSIIIRNGDLWIRIYESSGDIEKVEKIGEGVISYKIFRIHDDEENSRDGIVIEGNAVTLIEVWDWEDNYYTTYSLDLRTGEIKEFPAITIEKVKELIIKE